MNDWSGRRLRRRQLAVVPLVPLVPLGAAALAACGADAAIGPRSFPTSGPAPAGAAKPIAPGALIAYPDRDEWPDQFKKASPQVQEVYRYALSHQDVLQYMPCFCGCVSSGHQSNKDCYVQQALPDGGYVLEPMSFG